MKYQNERRSSIESMYEYDMPNSRESGYHKTYLKMVGATIALTFIGIIVFIELEKSPYFMKPELGKFTEQPLLSSKNGQPVYQSVEAGRGRSLKKLHKMPAKPSYSNTQQEFRQQWIKTGNSIPSKRAELRQHLKQILNLISDLKSSWD